VVRRHFGESSRSIRGGKSEEKKKERQSVTSVRIRRFFPYPKRGRYVRELNGGQAREVRERRKLFGKTEEASSSEGSSIELQVDKVRARTYRR